MQFAVHNRFTGNVQFTAETECAEDASISAKLGLAVKWGYEEDADLEGANLRRADLERADLERADLSGADLCDANLRGADLRDADLRDANLCDANLRGAKNVPAVISGFPWPVSIHSMYAKVGCQTIVRDGGMPESIANHDQWAALYDKYMPIIECIWATAFPLDIE